MGSESKSSTEMPDVMIADALPSFTRPFSNHPQAVTISLFFFKVPSSDHSQSAKKRQGIECAFHETFSESWEERWIYSTGEKYTGRFAVETTLEGSDNTALKVTEKAQHYGMSALLPTPLDPGAGKTVLQPAGLAEDTPYTIMFGPDVCGATNKVHLIIRHKSPKTNKIEEKHLTAPPMVPSESNVTHVYTAILDSATNTYSMLIDGEEKKSGSLFDHFDPSFNPPKEIDDPEDTKPEDWVDEPRFQTQMQSSQMTGMRMRQP
eukprot:jgi/Picre1/35778/NNA_003238.t1